MIEPGLRIMLALLVGISWASFMKGLGMDDANALAGGAVFFAYFMWATGSLSRRWRQMHVTVVPRRLEATRAVPMTDMPTSDVGHEEDEPVEGIVRVWPHPPAQKGLMRFERPRQRPSA